jgi:FHA domain-containing protein
MGGMNSEEIVAIAGAVDRWTLESRLRDISLLALSDRNERMAAIATVISRLPPGGYLLGCGPYSCGILPLTVDEVVLGRSPTPLESPPETVADFTLNDAVHMVPREASRIHAKILCRKTDDATEFLLQDANSRNGTYLNGRRIGVDSDGKPNGQGAILASGNVIWLGPSGINIYVFVDTR